MLRVARSEPGTRNQKPETRNHALISYEQRFTSLSGHQTPHVHGRLFIFRLALIFIANLHACDSIEVVVGILAGTADQQVFLLVHHISAGVLALLEIRHELDRVGRTGFFAVSAIDAP